jgi:hypothetical protein
MSLEISVRKLAAVITQTLRGSGGSWTGTIGGSGGNVFITQKRRAGWPGDLLCLLD